MSIYSSLALPRYPAEMLDLENHMVGSLMTWALCQKFNQMLDFL